MFEVERFEYKSADIERGARLTIDGQPVAVRNYNLDKRIISVGRAHFSEDDIQELLLLCHSFTNLTQAEALFLNILAEAESRKLNKAKKIGPYKDLWKAVATQTVTRERASATKFTDSVLFPSIPKVADTLEAFAIGGKFKDELFTEEFLPVIVDGKVIFPKSTCPASGIVRLWSGAYTQSRRIVAITHPDYL